ncbi:MAG: SGNH/GDSL hydrolase family protein [Burkholderiaceae bacterium]|nr:SGNH/GDSL hydrolase family protein [Burkholderiaceae bacterium]
MKRANILFATLWLGLIAALFGQTVYKSLTLSENGTVVAPTNFWATNAASNRASLGLATVATSGNYNDLTSKPVTGVSSVAGKSGAVSLDITDVSSLATVLGNKENAITGGTYLQYWRGDKTWATLPTNYAPATGSTNYATAAQGVLAGTALQPGASWTNISGLGTAATNAAAAFAPAFGSTNYAPMAGSTNIRTVGTITNGSWQAATVGLAYGGTGATNAKGAVDQFRAEQPTVPALKRITSRLVAGNSDTIGLVGDSTSSSSDKWWYQTLSAIGSYVGSNLRVVERINTDGTGVGWTENVIQAGLGEPYVMSPSGGTNRSVGISDGPLTLTGDLDLRFRIGIDSWVAGLGGGGYLLCQYNSPTNRTIFLTLGQGGSYNNILLEVYDQTNTLRQYFFNGQFNSTNFPAGTTKWLRITLDADNGASGSTAKAYVSTAQASEGASWTQIGSNATVGAVITGYTATLGNPMEVLGRQTVSLLTDVKLYRAEIRSGGIGDNYPVQNIQAPHRWNFNYTATSQVKPFDRPTLWVISDSQSGAALAGFTGSNASLTVPDFGQTAYLISFGYNDGNLVGKTWWDSLNTAKSMILARLPTCAIVPVSQPCKRTDQQDYTQTRVRSLDSAVWGENIGKGYIPALEAFMAAVSAGTPLTDLVSSDGTHPTAAGYTLWKETALRSFGIKP